MYDVNGEVMAVSNGTAIPAGTSALLLAGSDGTNARYFSVDSSGRPVYVGAGTAGSPSGGVLSIQGVSGGVAMPISITTGTVDTTASGALGALNATVSIALAGTYGVGMQLAAGTLIGTIVPEVSFDGGTTWVATFFDDPTLGNKTTNIVFASSNTATARSLYVPAGASNARVRVSAFTSGTASCSVRSTLIVEPPVLFSGQATAALPPTMIQIGAAVATSAPTYTTGTLNALSLTTAGALRIDGSGVTQPVSGTVAATQSGTWTVQPGNTANTTPWLTTINQGGNSAAVKAASTSANATDPALVVAVSPNGTVKVVGATASGTAVVGNPVLIGGQDGTNARTFLTDATGRLIVDGSSVTQPISGTVTVGNLLVVTGNATDNTSNVITKLPVMAAVAATSAPTWTNGNMVPLSVDTAGNLRTNASNPSVSATGSAPPASATYIGGSVTTAAPTYTTGQMSALSLTTTGALRIDGSSVTQPVSGTVTANAGTGNFNVVGPTAVGGTPATNPVLFAGTDGSNTVRILRVTTVGGMTLAADQTVGSGVPATAVQVGASDGTNIQSLRVTTGTPTGTENALIVKNVPSGTQTISGTVTSNQGTANSLANAWSTKITDATNGPVAVKPASTAAVATDPALVVAISPNNPITTTNADVTATGALGALNAAVTVTIPGKSSVGFQLAAGTLIGTIVAEVSIDGGTTWSSTYFDQTTGNKVSSIVFASSNGALTSTIVGVGGSGQVRVRVSAYTSGTANITVRASNISDPSVLSGGTAGSTLPPVMNQMGASVTTAAPTYTTGTLNALSLNTAGALRIDGSGTTQPISGTVTVSGLSLPFNIVGNAANGAATSGAPVLVAGYDGTNVRTFLTDSSGRQVTTQLDTSVTGTLTALNTTVTITSSGKYTIGGTITGTWVGTITAEGTVDGTNWFTVRTANKSTNDIIQNYTANDSFEFYSVAGCISLRLRMSAYTSGTATVTLAGTNLATDALLNYSSTEGDAAPPLRYLNMATLTNDGTSHSLRNTNVAPTGTEYALVTRSIMEAPMGSSSYPDQSNIVGSPADLNVDIYGNLLVRGPVFTDEGSLRDDFTGAALTTALTGTVNFTNASTAVTGTGTTFTTQIRSGQYIKKTADSETLYVQVDSIESNTALTLVSAYAGTTAGAASVVSNWQTVTGTGSTFTVANSTLTIATGTTANATSSIRSLGDYLPYSAQFYASISQRIVNQTFYMGFQDIVGLTPNQQATVQFSGTNNTQVSFVTCFASTASDTQTTTATIPNGGTTATLHVYKIDIGQNQATLSIDGVVVAINTIHIPSPYTVLYITAGEVNGAVAPASSTNFIVDSIFFQNVDRIQLDHDFNGEPMPVQGITPSGQAAQGNPFTVAGSVTTAAPTYTTGTINNLSLDTAGNLRITGTATNPSVSSTGAAPPASATYMGGSVTTAAPAYTTGQMSALSLTTAGLLRIDGVYPVNATTPTTDITFIGGAVTTAAPAYTTGQLSALSLTTAGSLRVASISEGAPAATAPTSATYVAGAVTTAAPAYTTAQMNPLSLTTAGDLRSVSKITDGTNTSAVKAASTAAVATDPALVVSLSPNSHTKATIQPLYGTSGQTITITLASLGSAAARQSTVVSNTTNLYEDALLFIKITPAAAGVSATGYVNVYAYGSADGGTNYPEGVTGTDGAYTVLGSSNLILLAQINVVANSTARSVGPISFCRSYGIDRLPAQWGIVVVNNTGAAFNATAGNFTVVYQGVNGQLV